MGNVLFPEGLLANLSDVSITSPANSEVLTYNSTSGKWVNNPVAGLVTSVSNSDGTLTISPTTGAVVASLNLANPNTWTGVQTFTQVIHTQQGGYASNTGIGTGALGSNTGDNSSSAFGYNALSSNTSGLNNSAFGRGSLFTNTTGGNNSAVGAYTLQNLLNGSGNTVLGYHAGINYNASESHNIILGYNPGVAGESNVLRIGNPGLGGTNGQIALSLISLAGLGVPAIYGTPGLGVNLGTTATQVATWTPAVTGFYSIRIAISCKVSSTVSFTISYADPQAGTITNQSIYSKALTGGTTDSAIFNLWAASGTAITLKGTDSVALGDAYASAQIEELQ